MTDVLPDLTTPAGILASAAADVAEAETRRADLESRLRDGDETVALDDLESAERQSRWARIRRDAAEKKAAAKAEELRRRKFSAAVEAHLPIVLEDRSAVIEDLLAKARPFIEQALALNAERNRAITVLATELSVPENWAQRCEDERWGYRTDQNAAAPMYNSVDFDGRLYSAEPASAVLTKLTSWLNPSR